MTEPTNGNNGFINHKIRFFIVNMDNIVIKCVAYGALAHVFHDLGNSTNANVVVCVLQFWKINWREGLLKHVTNIDGFSIIIFESNDVPEIDDFRKRIANHEF
ncbi:hypothetical protein F2Q68_00000967 [Brassica cretica]|uniref:Uncharacterized protein n=1 Tax=Brassica cretica TaxID=69181 RepID=A0A8S9JMV3_BRACR|nr:hypothetical protein F2Q68_00000967 [Brassica cretica]